MEVPPAETLLTVSPSGALDQGDGVSQAAETAPQHAYTSRRKTAPQKIAVERESHHQVDSTFTSAPLEDTVKSLQAGTAAGLGGQGEVPHS